MAYPITLTKDRSLLRTWRGAREWMRSPWCECSGRSRHLVHSRKCRPVSSVSIAHLMRPSAKTASAEYSARPALRNRQLSDHERFRQAGRASRKQTRCVYSDAATSEREDWLDMELVATGRFVVEDP
jgi:hypothetical protein